MIALLMMVSMIGTVILIGICSPLAPTAPTIPPVTYSFEETAEPNIREDFVFDFPISPDTFTTNNIEGGCEMQSDAVRDQMRRVIVEKSVQILREHGRSDEEIREMLLKDFQIDEDTLAEIMKTQSD